MVNAGQPGYKIDRPSDRANKKYIPTLDGWRAIAVTLVIGAHSVPMLNNSDTKIGRLLAGLLSHAGYGVDIFFALSGFLIATLLFREKENNGKIDIKAFYIRRFFRIIPPIVVYLSFVAFLASMGLLKDVHGKEVIASLVFLRNYVWGSWYTGHFWSLSIEEHFYAIVPLLITLLAPRRLGKIFIALIVICVLVRFYELSRPDQFQPLPQFRTENRVDALLWGATLALICRKPFVEDQIRRFLTMKTVIAVAIAAGLAVTMVDDQAIRRTIMAAVLPLLILSTVLRPDSAVGWLLELSFVRLIGRMSYSLYVWQMPFLVPDQRELGVVQNFPFAIIAIIVTASISFWFVEKPMIKIGHALSNRVKRSV